MQLIRGLYNLPHFENGCVLTIGNFDGCHRGHQAILSQLVAQAKHLDLPSVVLLFEPQPNEFFAPLEHTPARLMRLRDKVRFLQSTQIDYLLCLRFDRTLASLSPDEFIRTILVNRLHVKHIIIGDDFRFGAHRQGNFATLAQAGEHNGFKVQDNTSFTQENQRISSTLIRQALAQDNLAFATKMLGRPYAIHGRVVHGKKLGRTIGFPTANVFLNRKVIPIQGVYAVEVIAQQNRYLGVANVGNRPTVDGLSRPLLEVHLFDFSGSLYGQSIEVIFHHKLRPEVKFANITELKTQILQDVENAKRFFRKKVAKVRSDVCITPKKTL
ncbi:bifunctional riboflavin kinase/FAD synthetase [Spirabiliibacterium falconis]|uniref:bifunctional riboflavin kinase/FAD synthetase n=1 Tax=Spirabiliibacterium falconis TaxID=572023 RepID=UPI001AACAE5F|nr:bifunctional riboflavin kinase/FAD synthetase [Spirabiliibacterium falconis]MBE2893569.1 bifunctional riboflavin kinase/FAD synthetase [Spirabiliibacterium falconis]